MCRQRDADLIHAIFSMNILANLQIAFTLIETCLLLIENLIRNLLFFQIYEMKNKM